MSTSAPEYANVAVVELSHYGHRPLRVTSLSAAPAAAITADTQTFVQNDICALCGFAVAETTNAAGASFRLWDGKKSQGLWGIRVNLGTNESAREFWYPRGLYVSTGRLTLEVLSGSLEGVLFWV